MRLRIFALVLSVLATGCAAPEETRTETETGACNAAVFQAAQYARGLAFQRQENMKVMRFASEEAMNAYIEETTRLNAEADRLTNALEILETKYGKPPAHRVAIVGNSLSEEEAGKLIVEADTCAAPLIS